MAAQWDAYIKSIKDNAQGHCDQATIIGLKDGASWITQTCSGVSLRKKIQFNSLISGGSRISNG